MKSVLGNSLKQGAKYFSSSSKDFSNVLTLRAHRDLQNITDGPARLFIPGLVTTAFNSGFGTLGVASRDIEFFSYNAYSKSKTISEGWAKHMELNPELPAAVLIYLAKTQRVNLSENEGYSGKYNWIC